MANPVAVITQNQFSENLPCPPKLTSDHYHWSGIRAEIRWHLVPSWLNFPACTDHILTLNLNSTNEAKGNSEEVSHRDRKDDEEMSLAPAGIPFHLSVNAGRFMYLFIQQTFLSKVAGEVFYLDTHPVKLQTVINFQNEPLHHICLALHNELFKPGCGNKIYVHSLATALVVLLLRHYSSITVSPPEDIPTINGLLAWQWQRVTEHIHANLDGDLSLSELAKVLGISVYHFSRLFKERSGVSPHQYVMQQRVDQAKQLLADKRKTILDIALSVGFLNPAHFTTVFRKLAGMTPQAYRNRPNKQ